ncbi:MAG TPA: hypothetical protein ENO16_06735 [Chromatiales bacterium]|nr:hypothetical protein [Chromatiales bacterium]
MALVLLLVTNVWTLLNLDPQLRASYVEGLPVPRSNSTLIEWLDSQNIRHAYADYWISYRLMFETQEAVVCYTVRGLQTGWNRYLPHVQAVLADPQTTWVFVAGSASAMQFDEILDLQHVAFQKWTGGGYTVFYALQPPLRPGGLLQALPP